MKHETALQSDLIAAARAEGGYGQKLSNRFVSGIPDLLLQLPGMCTRIVECKCAVLPVKLTTPIKLELTALQRRTLRDMRAAGAFAGWFLIVTTTHDRNPPCYWVLTGANPDVETVTRQEIDQFGLIKKRGSPWPISKMLSQITMG